MRARGALRGASTAGILTVVRDGVPGGMTVATRWTARAAAVACVAVWAGAASAQQADGVYKSDRFKYSIQMPEGEIWEWGKSPGRDCVIQKKTSQADPAFLVIGVQCGLPGPGGTKDIKDIAADVQKEIRESFKPMVKDEAKNIKFAGCPCIQLVFQGQDKNANSIHIRFYVFKAPNGHVYMVDLQCLEGQEETHAKALEKALKSFKWWK